MMLSLRNRLLLGMIAGMTLLLFCSGSLVYWAAKQSLYSQCDAAMTATAQMLLASIEQQEDKIKIELDVDLTPRFQNIKHPDYYLIESDDGQVMTSSPSLDDETAAHLHTKIKHFGFRSTMLPKDQYVRALSMPIEPHSEKEDGEKSQVSGHKAYTLVVARDITELKSHLDSLQWLLFLTGAVTVALSVAVAVGVVDRGLRPVTTLASNINSISDESLQMRLGSDGVPPELMPVVNQLNNMLVRLEESFMRQRRFNADVAHELRTPLTGLSASLEVALLKPRTSQEYQETISTCLPIVRSMQTIVANLLELTRHDNGTVSGRFQPVRISEMVESCWQAVSAKAASRYLSFANNIPADMSVPAQEARLMMVFSNVLDNAVEYADAGGRVWTEMVEMPGKIAFSFCNTGSKLAPGEVAQVFDHFWRGDRARTNTGLHCGLGLAIVKKLAESLGGTVQAESRLDGIFKIVFSFPRDAGRT
jgi:heavy metal sensor kinase